jgi:hypothetical protein
MPVWDTSVASGLRPEGKLFELAAVAALAGEPIRLAAPTVAEIPTGCSADLRTSAACAWLQGEGLCTANQAHFSLLGRRIAQLFPRGGALEGLPVPS